MIERGKPDGSIGTAAHDAPVPRLEVERALRGVHASIEELRDDLLRLAAQVVALGDQVGQRMDGIEDAVEAATPAMLASIRAADARAPTGVQLGNAEDKYTAVNSSPPCQELLPICKARCCRMVVALSTQDLDEGVIRWDYGRPYLIKHRPEDGACVHNEAATGACTVYHHRPRPCRTYDCKDDPRIWIDYARRIPVPDDRVLDGPPPGGGFDLMERARDRRRALGLEAMAVRAGYDPVDPHVIDAMRRDDPGGSRKG